MTMGVKNLEMAEEKKSLNSRSRKCWARILVASSMQIVRLSRIIKLYYCKDCQ